MTALVLASYCVLQAESGTMADGEEEAAAPPPASKEEAAVGKAMDNLAAGGVRCQIALHSLLACNADVS